MAITAQNLLDRASDILQDTNKDRWPDVQMLRWLNDARREVAIVRPDLFATQTTISTVDGAKQSIPSDGMRLLDVIRNVTIAGAAGQSMRPIERDILDRFDPTWTTAANATTLKHFMMEQNNPRVFYVYPQAAAAVNKLEIVYQKLPVDLATTDQVPAAEEIYSSIYIDFICFRAFSEDAEFANPERSTAHFQRFKDALASGAQINELFEPDKPHD